MSDELELAIDEFLTFCDDRGSVGSLLIDRPSTSQKDLTKSFYVLLSPNRLKWIRAFESKLLPESSVDDLLNLISQAHQRISSTLGQGVEEAHFTAGQFSDEFDHAFSITWFSFVLPMWISEARALTGVTQLSQIWGLLRRLPDWVLGFDSEITRPGVDRLLVRLYGLAKAGQPDVAANLSCFALSAASATVVVTPAGAGAGAANGEDPTIDAGCAQS